MPLPCPPPPRALTLASLVRDAGGRAFIVGGWVRDALRGYADAAEVDMEVYGVSAERLKSLLATLGRVDAVGESFTVFKVAGLDVALPRRESKSGRGHRGFQVSGDPDMPMAEAVARRDFTINALLADPLSGDVIDLVGGRDDLARRVLRAVSRDTFGDDSLRVLRGLQFAARFGFDMDSDTRRLCQQLPLDDLASERIYGEMEKLLWKAPKPSIGLALGRDLGVVARLFPELDALAGCPQEPEWHPEGDVWTHTLLVVDRARELIADLDRGPAMAVLCGALCHDLGKPSTTAWSDGRIRSINHEAAGVAPATAFLDRLHIHTLDGFDTRREILGMVQYHLSPSNWFKSPSPVSDGAFRRLSLKVNLELLVRLARADCEGRAGQFDCGAIDWFAERAHQLGVALQPPAPMLLGRHVLALGIAPGPGVGAILKAVYERQLDGSVTDLDGAVAAARQLIARGIPTTDTRDH